MSRDKYQRLKKYFHVADNANLEVGNKVAKVSQMYKFLNENLCRWGIFHDKLSIDESMVPYFGRHSAKMFIRGKPIRFGFKIWALCGADGYPYKLDIYTGKNSNRDPKIPLGQQVVEDMLSVVSSKSRPEHHAVFFDNFFSSVKLLESLADQNFLATGTIRDNRTSGASKALISNKIMKNKERGSFDYRSNGKVYICK